MSRSSIDFGKQTEAYNMRLDHFDTVIRSVTSKLKQEQRQERGLHDLLLTQRRDHAHRTTVRLHLVVLIAQLEEEVQFVV
jgi:hypothetical protein